MFLLSSTVPDSELDLIYSASDLVTASQCEYQLLRLLDEKLGRTPKLEPAGDEMLERTAVLGDVHERRVLEGFVSKFGLWDPATQTGVYDVVPAANMSRCALLEKHDESIAALRDGADVVFQGSFFDGQFHGRSDFLVKQPGGSYAVFDTKLARRAKVGALLQLAAYGDQLLQAGVKPAPEVTLVLGDNKHSNHRLDDLLPIFRERRQRLLDITSAHRGQPEPVAWGRPGLTACGRCDHCQEKVAETRDLLLVANMSITRRKKLNDAGITTIDQLANMEVTDGDKTLSKLQDQARMQTGTGVPDGSVTYKGKDGSEHTVSYRVLEENALAALPNPSEGDIFFDFEGDPLWQDDAGRWGIEYLFGVVENPSTPGGTPPFKPYWAHSRAEERQAFVDFLDYVRERRKQYPDLKIYHYAAYEKTALRHLSLRHTIGEDAVDDLLREGVLVDLYETVRNSLRISDDSYSIKKLEPLYMGDNLRQGDVLDAGASVVAYADYCEARDAGDDAGAKRILAGIADYNEYDCLSTLELRNWLLKLAAERGIRSAGTDKSVDRDADDGQTPAEPSPGEMRLLDYVASLPANRELTADDQAVALVAAAVGYHRREDKQFWWAHFDRLNAAIEAWADTKDVFTVHYAEVVSDWERPTAKSLPARQLQLSGVLAGGSDYRPGKSLFRMYDPEWPDDLKQQDLHGTNGRAGWFGTEILDTGFEDGLDVVIVKEKLKRGGSEYEHLPVALSPDQPIATTSLRAALAELAISVGLALPSLPTSPALDILRRVSPRLTSLPQLPRVETGPTAYIDAITAAVADLDHSYLAVQGPPGTGKTYVGSHVVANLVARGWKVGVVGQSHAVVENLLIAALQAGVPKDQVAKKTERDAPWTHCGVDDVGALLGAEGGALVGGTAWTMTGRQVPAGSLDLLVIDEAGQFCLADTLAVSRATRRLLLLGDPQQLPQVSQGKHPEPVNESALGWLTADHPTLPEEMGYFLADSWRMHPALCAQVSRLAYEGKLHSASAAAGRHLKGAPAGVECVMVDHIGRSTSSPEEAAEVVRQVQRHLGLLWSDGAGAAPRPLAKADLLVVAAYNAQVQLIQQKLADAELHGLRVGTVDKFQGQEGVVVIVSMACSTASEAPRGMEFLVNRNRVNVAVSRGMWRAVVVRSPELTHHMPTRPFALEELGAFVGLCDPVSVSPSETHNFGDISRD